LALAGVGPTGSAQAGEPLDPVGCVTLERPVSDDGSALPFADPACTDARPGAGYVVTMPSGNYLCSLAFLFEGDDGTSYFATAGHCLIDGAEGESSWSSGAGPEVRDLSKNLVGHGRWARLDNNVDIGLIEVAEGVTASPEVCHFGGPTGMAELSSLDPPRLVHHYGYGRVWRDHLKARTGLVTDYVPQWYLRMATNVGGGDSGSSVIDANGRAVGIVVRGLATGAGYAEASRLDVHLPLAEEAVGTTLTLQTAPLRTLVGTSAGP
jgi:hypothetical protein